MVVERMETMRLTSSDGGLYRVLLLVIVQTG